MWNKYPLNDEICEMTIMLFTVPVATGQSVIL